MTFKEWMADNSSSEAVAQLLNRTKQYVISSAREVNGRVSFTFPKNLKENSEEERKHRHDKGWGAYKGLQQVTDPTQLGWNAKQQFNFKRTMTAQIANLAQPLGFLFELEVFDYLVNKGLYDIDKGAMDSKTKKEEYYKQIDTYGHTSAELIKQMVAIHAADLGEQMRKKTISILGCADMIFFAGGFSSWKAERDTPGDIFLGCSENVGRTGYSVKFGTETKISVARISINNIGRILGYTPDFDLLQNSELDTEAEKKTQILKLIYDGAKRFENNPKRFTKLLNYLITGNDSVIPAFRNYASSDIGNVGWSVNIQKDFAISRSLENPLRPRDGSTVKVDVNNTYVRMTYKVPGGSFSGTTILLEPKKEKINIKVTNLTSSRR